MGKVYQSVRGVVQGTLHRRKPDIMVPARANGNDTGLNDVMEELEKVFVEGMGRLKSAVSDDRAMVESEAHQAEQVIEGLKANIVVLEAKLREREDTLHSKDLASRKMEETLGSEIRDLQSVVKLKEEALQSRDSELNDFKSKREVLEEQIARLELTIQQAKEQRASEVQQTEQVIEGLRVNITALEAKLREREESFRAKDLASQNVEETLRSEIRDLQSAVKLKEEILESRDSELNDLKSKREILTEQVTNLERAIQQAKEERASEAQQADQVIEGLRANIAALEAKVKESEDTLHSKELASQKLEETLSSEIRDLEGVAQKNEETLESRDSELNDIKSKRDVLAIQVTQLQLSIQQAKEEREGEAERAQQVIQGLMAKIATLEAQLLQTEKTLGGTDWTIKGLDQNQYRQVIDLNAKAETQTNGRKETVTPIVAEAPPKTVSRGTFDRIIVDFSERTNVIGSIASLIVRDHVRALGETMEEFPQRRLKDLLHSLGGQIPDDKLRADFRERFSKV